MRIKKPEKPKKYYDRVKRARKKADKLWHEAVIKKWGDKCEVCDKKAVHCHHFYPKGLYSLLRLEVANGVPLCFHCHFSRHHKGDPKINQAIIKKRGQQWYELLKKQAQEKPEGSYQNLEYYLNVQKSLSNL